MHVKHTINHGVNLQPQVLQKDLGQEVSKAEHVINRTVSVYSPTAP